MVTRTLGSFCALAALAAGCYVGEAEGPPFRAQIIDTVDIDPETSEPSFSLVTREFSYLEDLDSLEGPELRLFRGGTLYVREIAGSLAVDGRFVGAESPRLRYVTDGGVAIARDYPTLAMLSAYYQYERVIEDLERVTGLAPSELAEQMGQIEVFFEPAIRTEDASAAGEIVPKFNAFYVPGLKQFGLAQRSELENVPLSVNRQVIAHEFGHGLFELTFDENDLPDCDPERAEDNEADPLFPGRFSLEYAISGMNEGFADFISFAYTGGTNAIAALPFSSAAERDFASSEFEFSDLEGDEPACLGSFYCIGTLFARALYGTMLELDYDPADPAARGAFSRDVVAAMAQTKQALRELPESVVPLPDPGIAQCGSYDEIELEYDGAVTGAFLAAFASRMPAEARGPLCERFEFYFGELGFPGAAREACDAL
jgi:hypothetical protein